MTATLQRRTNKTPPAPVDATKRVGMVVRVSTDRQAQNDEGSLKNQVQRLRQHLAYKRDACGEPWQETQVYELKAISGKDSMRSQELERLFADIRSGRVNTVLCTALDRICRSVKDFLWFCELLLEHKVEFVCLKQNYDTTTPQGKLFITIMMALAEFEREQTADRTRDAHQARSERGLWNGGRLLGYDPDPKNKGSLLPNPDEVAIVAFAFDAYLECGSIKETAEALNRRGYRTKVYTSRRGQMHSGAEFNLTSVQYLLKNVAYIAKKEVTDAAGETRVIDAVWPAIIETSRFEEVQRLMATNGQHRHNGAQGVRHVHVLGGGLLACGRCAGPLEGRSGTGRLGKTYFYYVCTNKECGLRVASEEIEGAVLECIGQLAQEDGLLEQVVAETNERLLSQAPALEKQQKAVRKQLERLNAEVGKLLGQWAALEGSDAQAFLREQLEGLARQRADVESGVQEVEAALRQVQDRQVTAEVGREALAEVGRVYEHLKPYEQRELMRLVVHRAELRDEEIILEINGNLEYADRGTRKSVVNSSPRFQTPVWLPERKDFGILLHHAVTWPPAAIAALRRR